MMPSTIYVQARDFARLLHRNPQLEAGPEKANANPSYQLIESDTPWMN
jgi:hypothetical protein